MVLVKRANCECFIAEDKISEFLALGYSVIDKNGEILKRGKATSKEDLLIEVDTLTKENENLKTEIASLKKANNSLKDEIEVLKKDNPVKFKCPYCEKEYSTQTALDKHIREKHPE